MRAFVLTLITVSLMSLLVLTWISFQESAVRFEGNSLRPQSLAFSRIVFEAVFDELHRIAGPDFSTSPTNTTVMVFFNDTLPKPNITAELDLLDNFIEANYSRRIHANLSLDLTNLTDNSVDFILSGHYVHRTNSSTGASTVEFYSLNGAQSGVTRYDINVTTLLVRQSVTSFSWDPTGDINVSLTYSDSNGSVTLTGLLRNGTTNTFSILYANNQTTNVTIGALGTKRGALLIGDTAGTAYSLAVHLPFNMSQHLTYGYEASLNYTQGVISKYGRVERD